MLLAGLILASSYPTPRQLLNSRCRPDLWCPSAASQGYRTKERHQLHLPGFITTLFYLIKVFTHGKSLVVWWLGLHASTEAGTGLIPGQGTAKKQTKTATTKKKVFTPADTLRDFVPQVAGKQTTQPPPHPTPPPTQNLRPQDAVPPFLESNSRACVCRGSGGGSVLWRVWNLLGRSSTCPAISQACDVLPFPGTLTCYILILGIDWERDRETWKCLYQHI